MKILKPWFGALNIAEPTIQSWLSELPRNKDLTFWCLRKKKIAPEAYFEWAQNHYELALVQSKFFAKPNLDLWQKIQSVANWSESMIPIAEWDGTIFIACVEPPEEIRWSFPVRYVLASAEDLSTYWEALHPATITSPQPKPDTKPKPEPEPASASTSASKISPVHAPAAKPHPVDIQDIDAPAGFNMTIFSKKANQQSDDHMDQLKSSLAHQSDPDDMSAPENLTWRPATTITLKDLAPVGVDVTNVTSITTAEGTQAVTENSESQEQPPLISAEVVTDAKPITKEQTSTETGAPEPDSVPTEHQDHSHLFKEMLPIIQSEFLGGMIIEIRNEQFVPVAWDKKFDPSSLRAQKPWSLSSASAFRISYRSRLPYLGHVVDTPINREFFNAWGFSQMPESILLQPIRETEGVRFLVLALVEPGKKNEIVLNSGIKLTQKISELLNQSKAA